MVNEVVGPDGAHEDLSASTDRQLMVRAINEILFVRFDLGTILRELAALTRRVELLEHASGAPPTPRRETSRHDWSEALARLSSDLTARVKDPKDKMDSDRARSIASEVVRSARVEEKAVAYDKRDAEIHRLRVGAILAVVTAIVAAVVGHLVH